MGRYKRLILHVGLPKTGTSALQSWCDRYRTLLRGHDIDYPEARNNLPDPKHQFLVLGLRHNNLETLDQVLAESDCGTVLLSAEGLTNHFYDFDCAAFETFRRQTRDYEVTIFMVVREKVAWTMSYYKQAIINRPKPEYNYGTPLKYDEFCRLPRVRRLVELPSRKDGLRNAFGANEVVVARYEEDWTATLFDIVGLPNEYRGKLPLLRVSVSEDLIAIVRQVNAMMLSPQARNDFLAVVNACFPTLHSALKYLYRLPQPAENDGESNRAILSQLVAETPAQAHIIEALKAWL